MSQNSSYYHVVWKWIQAGVAQEKKVSSCIVSRISVLTYVLGSQSFGMLNPIADANLTVKMNEYFVPVQQKTAVDALTLFCDKEVV